MCGVLAVGREMFDPVVITICSERSEGGGESGESCVSLVFV